MFLRTLPALTVLGVLIVSASSAAAAVDRWPCTRVGQGEIEQRIMDALDAPTSLDFDEAPLVDVLAYLAELHHIPMVIDGRALRDQAITPDSPVTLHLGKVSLRSALWLLLRDHNLDYVIRDEVLQITSPEVAAASAPVCLFDVSVLTPDVGDMDTLMTTIHSNIGRSQLQITAYHSVLLVKGNQRQQDDLAAFLAALMRTKEQAPEAAH